MRPVADDRNVAVNSAPQQVSQRLVERACGTALVLAVGRDQQAASSWTAGGDERRGDLRERRQGALHVGRSTGNDQPIADDRRVLTDRDGVEVPCKLEERARASRRARRSGDHGRAARERAVQLDRQAGVGQHRRIGGRDALLVAGKAFDFNQRQHPIDEPALVDRGFEPIGEGDARHADAELAGLSGLAGSHDVGCVGEERRQPAGVDEHDRVVRPKPTRARKGDEAGHPGRRVDRVQEQSFEVGRQGHRLATRRRQNAVPGGRARSSFSIVEGSMARSAPSRAAAPFAIRPTHSGPRPFVGR